MTREQLEARATELGIKIQANMKDETIASKIAAKEAEDEAAKNLPKGEQSKTLKSAPQDDDPDAVIAKPLYPTTHDGEDYAIGEEFFCTPKQRDALVASGSAEAVD